MHMHVHVHVHVVNARAAPADYFLLALPKHCPCAMEKKKPPQRDLPSSGAVCMLGSSCRGSGMVTAYQCVAAVGGTAMLPPGRRG